MVINYKEKNIYRLPTQSRLPNKRSTGMCIYLRVIGWVRTVLARGALPCVLLCGLPDSQPSYRWHSVSAVCSAGTLTQPNGHMIHRYTHKTASEHVWTSELACLGHVHPFHLWENSPMYQDKSRISVNGVTSAYKELLSKTLACLVRQILAGVAAAGVLANPKGRTTGTIHLTGSKHTRSCHSK